MNYKLLLNILSSINGGLITGAALFNPLVGQSISLKIISVLGICQIVVSAINSNLSTQGNTVKEVLAMPGVEGVTVNAKANQTLAQIALDPALPKIDVTPADKAVVSRTANAV